MTEHDHTNLHSGQILYPYLVAATDKYYNVNPRNEEKQKKREVNSKRNKLISKFTKGFKRKKLRILITTYWDYPAVGGLQNYITTLKNGLEKLGHSVDIVSPNQFPKDSKEEKKKLVKETKQFYKARYGSYSEKLVKENVRLYRYEMMLKDMKLDRYDIFHAQDRFTANIVGRLNQVYKKPLLFTPHGFMTQRKVNLKLIEKGSVEEAFYLSVDQKAIEYADQVITLCEAFRPYLKNLGAIDSKVTTVYTGIEQKFETSSRKSKTQNNKKIITCISRLRPRKGHKYLLEALASIKKELDDVEVWIVGDGEMREELENHAQDLRLRNVTFLGERKDIAELLSQSDIFVLPTTSDTLPISIIEAMFANQAILTTNIGGIPEIIQDHYSGLVAEPGNSKQLAEMLLLLLRDSALRNTLAQNAKTFAEENLQSTCMVKRIEEIYQTLHAKEVGDEI